MQGRRLSIVFAPLQVSKLLFSPPLKRKAEVTLTHKSLLGLLLAGKCFYRDITFFRMAFLIGIEADTNYSHLFSCFLHRLRFGKAIAANHNSVCEIAAM